MKTCWAIHKLFQASKQVGASQARRRAEEGVPKHFIFFFSLSFVGYSWERRCAIVKLLKGYETHTQAGFKRLIPHKFNMIGLHKFVLYLLPALMMFIVI
jgi:hypothetical protein